MGRYPKLFSVTLTFITWLCLIESRQLTEIEVLQRATCETVYKKAQGNRKDINFTNPIGNLSCKPGQNGHTRYHCMENEDGHFIQFCTEWIWIEPRLCPKLYSLQGIINPVACDKTKDCPKDRYQSHEYYKYLACFNITKKNEHDEGITGKQGLKPEDQNSEGQLGDGMIALIVIIGVLTVIGITVGVLFVLNKRGMVTCINGGRRVRRDTVSSEDDRSLLSGGGRRVRSDTVRLEDDRLLLSGGDFIIRKVVDALDNCIKSKRHILLTGRRGAGVSSVIEQIRSLYTESRWQRDNNVELNFDAQATDFVLYEYNVAKLPDELLTSMKEADGHPIFIIIVECQWFEFLRQRMSQHLADKFKAIDLSSDTFRLSKNEKRELLDAICTKRNITFEQLPHSKRDEIASFKAEDEKYIGYPSLCTAMIIKEKFDDPVGFMKQETLMKKGSLVQEEALSMAKAKIEKNSSFMVTGLPGSGMKTFMEHLKDDVPMYNWEELKYKTLQFESEEEKNIAVINESILIELGRSLDGLKHVMQSSNCVCIFYVKRSWYDKNYDQFSRDLGAKIDVIDLSSDDYKLNENKRLMLIDKLCEGKKNLSMEKRKAIASFNNEYCGFPLLLKELLKANNFDNLEEDMKKIDRKHK